MRLLRMTVMSQIVMMKNREIIMQQEWTGNCQDEEMVSEEEGDVSVDMEEGELVIKDKKKTKKQFSRQQRFLMEQEDKEEIVGEAVE